MKNEFKKSLYKTQTSIGEVNFVIPTNDMGEADFLPEMDSKLLIRWMEV